MILINTDGSVEEGNPGGHGVAGWIAKSKEGKEIARGAVDLGRHPWMTNNIAEYEAVRAALNRMLEMDLDCYPITIRSDSRLVVNQLNSKWVCTTSHLRKIRDQIWLLTEKFSESVLFAWVPRSENSEADAISRSLY